MLEVHLLDFDQLIYGQRIHVEFKKKIREEQTFDSLDAMVTKIHSDIALARQYFAAV